MKRLFVVLWVLLGVLAQAKFLVGVGGYDACYENGVYRGYDGKCTINANITDFLKKEMPNVNAISIWITRDFNFKTWFRPEIINRDVVGKGYTPIFIIYWYRDDISPEFVEEHEDDYFDFLQKCKTYLSKIKGTKYVILNPEYNENGVEEWEGFNEIMKRSYFILKDNTTILGYGLGDFGDYDKTFDYTNFSIFAPSFKAVKYYDFIAFQEMRATTKNSRSEILNTPYRSLEFAKYLHEKYHKPTFIAYLAISSYMSRKLQKDVYKRYAELIPIFKEEADLIGFNIFHLWDRPQQFGFFNQAEKYFGIIDKKGHKKPSYEWFRKIK